MNPVRVFPLKFQPGDSQQQNNASTSSSPQLKRKSVQQQQQQQPSDRNHTLNMSPANPVLTPSKSRQTMKRYTTMNNPTQEDKLRMLTQKKLSVMQPTSYSPKKRVISTGDRQGGDAFYLKPAIQQQADQSPTRLPNLKKTESSITDSLQKIDLSLNPKRSKRTETNGDAGTPISHKQQLLKLYQDISPKIKPTTTTIRAKVGSQTLEQQDIKMKGAPMIPQMHGRSTSQAALASTNPITENDQPQDIISLFISKSQAGQNGNKQTKTNQDSVILQNNFGGFKNRYLFAVNDGHGVYGHYVSQLVKRVLPQILDSQIKQTIGKSEELGEEHYAEMAKMYSASFSKMTKDLANCGIDITFSGSTCVTVIVSGQNIWCGNIGDSRAIFIGQGKDGKWSTTELSNDHKPDLPSEKKRILQCKGRVMPFVTQDGQNIGPARVWLQHDQIPGLAMSRSFGDYVASTVGVISEPEMIYHRVENKLGFLVVASDGIWEFLTNEELQKMVLQQWTPNMTASRLDAIADLLVRESTRRWQEEDEVVDDISIVLAYVQRP